MTAPATGLGAQRESGGVVSTGHTGPAVIVPSTVDGPPAGETSGGRGVGRRSDRRWAETAGDDQWTGEQREQPGPTTGQSRRL